MYKTLPDMIVKQAERDPRRIVLVFIDETGTEMPVSAAELTSHAARYARAFAARGITRGDLIIIVLQHSIDVLYAFWGAMAVGAVPAIFPYLTEKLDPSIYFSQVRALADNAAARLVLTFPEFRSQAHSLLGTGGCEVADPGDLLGGIPEEHAPLPIECGPDDVAMLLYSSGTTGLQKGIPHSHRAVLTQIERLNQHFGVEPDDVRVSWLPFFHDMGLITSALLPPYSGTRAVVMSPFTWVRSPKTFLWAIHRFRGTLTAVPNFALNHMVRGIRERDLQGLDLSSIRILLNASEPVRLDSHERFVARFKPYGFSERALMTGYGMTEITGAASLTPDGGPVRVDWIRIAELQSERLARPVEPHAPGAMPIVSCGTPLDTLRVAIADDDGTRLIDRHVGEIVIQDESMFHGYHRRPDLTAEALRDGWFYSGDIGYLADGQLYVCGRKKDVIIQGGRNIHPEALEAVANTVAGIYPGRAVAFGIADEGLGSERIVMVCELRGKPDDPPPAEIERTLRRRTLQEFEIALADLCLTDQRGWVIKTSNGKIARSANRDKYLQMKSASKPALPPAAIPPEAAGTA